MKPLPYTLCVKGHWYFRAPSTRKTIKIHGEPGDAAFMAMYRRLMNASGGMFEGKK